MNWNFLDVLFPRKCLGCGKEGEYLCVNCYGKINFHPQQRCAVCNRNSIDGRIHYRCNRAWGLDGVWAATSYEGVMRTVLHKFKYGDVRNLNRMAAGMMAENLPAGLKEFELVVPVPLFGLRKRWRGFNQAEMLARELGKRLGVEVNSKILIRKKFGLLQAQIKERKKRLANLRQGFEINPEMKRTEVRGKRILLVDDIVTTGTTLRRAALPLKRAGASQVWGVVVAR